MTHNLIELDGGSAFRNHPLISTALARGENRNVFEAFVRDFVRELRPHGPVEATFAARAAGLAWRINRAQGLETAALCKRAYNGESLIETSMNFGGVSKDSIEMISRWEQSLERSLLKMLDTLDRLQRRRRKEYASESTAENGSEMEDAIETEIKRRGKSVIVMAQDGNSWQTESGQKLA